MGAFARRTPTSAWRNLAAGLITISTAALVGVLTTLYADNFRLVIILLSIVLSPFLLVLIIRVPELAGGVLVFVQIFEAFELETPVGFVSLGTILLVIYLLVHLRGILYLLNHSRYLSVQAIFLLLLIGAHGLQVLHVEPAVVVRGLVTLFSFAMYWLIGIKLSSSMKFIRATVIGSALALLVLGILGILASSGVIPAPTRIIEPRAFFGFVSPFQRNYGLNLSFAGVALLVPLCAPWIFGQALFTRSGLGRLFAFTTYVTLAMLSLLVFQSRSMILIFIVVPAIIIAISSSRSILRLASISLGLGCVMLVLPGLLNADEGIGSSYRTDSFGYIFEYLRTHPTTLLIGTDVDEIRAQVVGFSAYTELVGEAPIHNMFLGELLQGGVLAAGSLAMLFAIPLFRARQLLSLGAENRQVGSIVIAALSAAFIEIMVNPIEANVAGLWLALGIAAAIVAPSKQVSGGMMQSRTTESLNRLRTDLQSGVTSKGMVR